jgi:uncharacterized protein (TIGR03382 family)
MFMKARTNMCLVSLAGIVAAAGAAGLAGLVPVRPARAQTFPAEDAWLAFRCANRLMSDGLRDQPAAVEERDLVGDQDNPAGFHGSDDSFLYLRLRVDGPPTMGANLRLASWGFALRTVGVNQDYQVLITVDGRNSRVGLYRNTVISVPNSPTDPADNPPAATYPFSTHGRTLVAGSNFGGERDYLIDMAVPWTALAPLGFDRRQAFVLWAASSSAPDRLDGDFACHDARGGPGVPDLDGSSSSDSTSGAGGSGGSGTGGSGGSGTGGSGGASSGTAGASGPGLEGGPSCHAGPRGGAPGAACALVLALLAWLRARRRG